MRFTSRTTQSFAPHEASSSSLSRRMAFHVASALIMFSVVQLWATTVAIDAGGPRWMPLVGLAIIVLGAIPFARILERRWTNYGKDVLPSKHLTVTYRRDLSLLWTGAIVTPLLWVITIAEWFSSHAVIF